MDVRFERDHADTLTVHLRDGQAATSVAVRPASAGLASLRRALDDAVNDGYGECFWPALTGGQYWWMFKRDADTLEVIAMWHRGGASLWEHVFRAADSMSWVQSRIAAEMDRLSTID